MSDYRVTLLAEQAGSSQLTAAWTERQLEGRGLCAHLEQQDLDFK